jgi:hypothetical protein
MMIALLQAAPSLTTFPRRPRTPEDRANMMLHRIVQLPACLPVPSSYNERYRRSFPCRVGRVVDVLQGGGVVVQFFGYYKTWDYTAHETVLFDTQFDY